MNRDIKTLLHLSSIPGFKLLPDEQARLDEWKSQQAKIVPKVARKKRTPKGYTKLDEMGAGDSDGTLVPTESLGEVSDEAKQVEKEAKKAEKKAVKNIVKPDLKEVGKIEES